jgi:hypothetical protein
MTELNIEEGVSLEEYKDVDKEEEEDDTEQDGNLKEELVLSYDMQRSVIVVAP